MGRRTETGDGVRVTVGEDDGVDATDLVFPK
jgi:hypothetical protein